MPWQLTETSEPIGNLTDDELLKLYQLVSHGSAPYHTEIADKLVNVAKTAASNLHQESHWENEGGASKKKAD